MSNRDELAKNPAVVEWRIAELEDKQDQYDAKQSKLEALIVTLERISAEFRAETRTTIRIALGIGAFALVTAIGMLITLATR